MPTAIFMRIAYAPDDGWFGFLTGILMVSGRVSS